MSEGGCPLLLSGVRRERVRQAAAARSSRVHLLATYCR